MTLLEIAAPCVLLIGLAIVLRRLGRYGASRPLKGLAIHRLTQPHLDDEGWHVELRGLGLSVWTASLNTLPGLIIGTAPGGGGGGGYRKGPGAGSNSRSQAGMRKLYDAGSLLGLVGMLFSVGGALWALGSVWSAVWSEFESHAGAKGAAPQIFRRALDTAIEYAGHETSSRSGGIQPVIPGVTVPWSHLPTIALAVLFNQIIHELGHALSGALDDLQMTKFALNLYACIPSATVTFPSGADSLPIRAKLRLAAAGPLHNLLVYLAIALSISTGIGHVFWRYEASEGVVVESVQPSSPLYGHLKPGHLITHLDDVFLGDRFDLWSTYLHSTEAGDEGQGWCVDRSVYDKMHAPPCLAYPGTVTFEPVDPKDRKLEERCIATHPILHIPSSICPCPSSKWICVRPARAEEILRIRLANEAGVSQQGTEGEVVLYAGDRREVFEGAKVGAYGARFAGPLVRWYTLFLKYLSSVAISLFLLNLLPFPRADGSAMLRSLLALWPVRAAAGSGSSASSSPPSTHRSFQATLNGTPHSMRGTPVINLSRQYELNSDDEDDYDAETGGRGSSSRKEEAWKRRFRRAVEGSMVGIAAGWAVGWMFLSLLRSS